MPKGNGQIKKLRIQMQLSQNKAAGRVGVDSATYRRAENGTENVTELTLEKIAAGFSSLLKRPISAAALTADEMEEETFEQTKAS